MKILVCSNVISAEMHIATSIEIIQNHLDKKNRVYFFPFERKQIKCFKHDRINCQYCLKQKNYVYKSIFRQKLARPS